MTILFGLLTTLVCCTYQSNNLAATKNLNDTTSAYIKSGFYIVINDTTDVALRKLNSITKDDFANGKTFMLSLHDYLSFDILDSMYVQYSKRTKFYDINFRFTNEGQDKFYVFTNKSNDIKYLSDNGHPKLGVVIDNRLIQVVTIFGPFSGNEITLSGIFDEQTANDLKKKIDKEINNKAKVSH